MGDPHGAQELPGVVEDGGLVGLELAQPVLAQHLFIEKAGLLPAQHLFLRLQADIFPRGVVVGLQVPDVVVPPALDVPLGFSHRLAEGVVDLLVGAPQVLEPDQVRDAVDGGVQVGLGQPQVLAEPAFLQQAAEPVRREGGRDRAEPEPGAPKAEGFLGGGHLTGRDA